VRCHRMVSLLVAMFAAIVMAPAAAHAAEPYPAETPPASVSDGTVEPGGTVTFSGSGMQPYEKVSIEVNYSGSDSGAAYRPQRTGGFVLASAHLAKRLTLTTTADGNGDFSIEVPLTEVGTATLVATGVDSGTTVTTTVEVAPQADNGDNGDNGDDGDTDNGGGGGDDGDNDSDDVSLPTTGPSSTPLLVAAGTGVGAILLGTGLLLMTRSRRRDTGA
jgi:LPXTG-motif cell wall-anchored protein